MPRTSRDRPTKKTRPRARAAIFKAFKDLEHLESWPEDGSTDESPRDRVRRLSQQTPSPSSIRKRSDRTTDLNVTPHQSPQQFRQTPGLAENQLQTNPGPSSFSQSYHNQPPQSSALVNQSTEIGNHVPTIVKQRLPMHGAVLAELNTAFVEYAFERSVLLLF